MIEKECLSELLDNSCEGIYVTDHNYTILYVNQTMGKIARAGGHYGVLEGTKCYRSFRNCDQPCPSCRIDHLKQNEFIEREYTSPSGRVYVLRSRLIDWEGIPSHIEYVRDITSELKIRSRLDEVTTCQKSQFDLYQQILDASEDGLIVTDADSDEVYFANTVARKQNLPFEAKKVQGRWRFTQDGETYQISAQAIDWMGCNAVLSYFTNITDEINLQKQLKRDEARYRLVVEKSGIALMDYDMAARKLYTNAKYKQYALADEGDRVMNAREVIYDVIHPDDCAAMLESFEECKKTDEAVTRRARFKMRDGSYRWTIANMMVQRDKDGNEIRKMGFFLDADEETHRYEELKNRYNYELARQQSFDNGVIERMTLDLTERTVVAAANRDSSVLHRLVGARIQDLVSMRVAHIKDPKQEEQFRAFLNAENLLRAYYAGEEPSLESRAGIQGSKEEFYWYCATAKFAKNPATDHVMAFIDTKNVDEEKMRTMLMHRLMQAKYDNVLLINVKTGNVKISIDTKKDTYYYRSREKFEKLVEERVKHHTASDKQQDEINAVSIEVITEKLNTIEFYSGQSEIQENGKTAYKLWTAAYFDKQKEYILFTVVDVSQMYKQNLEQAQELRTALDAAEVASRAKSTFLANMSHEIRTPISTVAGVLELLRQDSCAENPDINTMLERIEMANTANNYLLTLVNDVLDISKIESNELKLNEKATDIRQIIRSLSDMIEPLAQKKGIHTVWQRKSSLSNWYIMDGIRVQQILMNLVNNAIKFTPSGGSVTFIGWTTELGSDMVKLDFVIQDTGIGISPEFAENVFEPFRQEHYGMGDNYGGTGLGLAISRNLARMMGGDIVFESTLGVGTSFHVTIRLWIASPEGVETSKNARQEAEKICLDNIHVLLCEDNKVNRNIIQTLLEKRGCHVTYASDGIQAVEIFSNSPVGGFDLVLMDIRMPNMDGLEAARTIRGLSRKDAGTIPIIAMSANAYAEDVALSIQAGMNEHLSKPVDVRLLCQTIAGYCRK